MTMPQATSDDKARAYIDSVVVINQKYGMDGNITAEEYDEAVAAAAAVFRPLHRLAAARR
jgi:hypothetical protein